MEWNCSLAFKKFIRYHGLKAFARDASEILHRARVGKNRGTVRGGLVLEAPQTLQIPKSCWSSSSITGSSQEMYESSHFPFGSFNHCLKQVTAALNFEIHCDKGDFCYSLWGSRSVPACFPCRVCAGFCDPGTHKRGTDWGVKCKRRNCRNDMCL